MEKYLTDMRNKIVKLENVHTQAQHIDENSLVITIFTDFRKNEPIFVRPNTSADDAYDIMKIRHVRSLFVLNEANEVIGVITSRILSDIYVLEFMAKNNVRTRADVQVSDLMIHKENIHALDYDILLKKQFTIKEIIQAFCHLHERHIFVTQTQKDNSVKIIGIISAADIARGLNINLDPQLESLTFSYLAQR